MTPDSCLRVLKAGGSLVVSGFTPDSLVRLAHAAAESGAHLTVKGGLTPDSMVRVATAGKGHVTFDITAP